MHDEPDVTVDEEGHRHYFVRLSDAVLTFDGGIVWTHRNERHNLSYRWLVPLILLTFVAPILDHQFEFPLWLAILANVIAGIIGYVAVTRVITITRGGEGL